MAKKVAKAKVKRRVLVPMWIVRDDDGEYHRIISHQAPKKNKSGNWLTDGDWGEQFNLDNYKASVEVSDHLAPGGGPLKMKLVRV